MQFVWRFNVKRVSWTVHLDWCSLSHVITPLHAQCQQLYKTCPGLILITCNYGLPLNQRGVKPRTHQPVFHSRLHGLPQLRNFHIGSKCINIFKETASAVWEDTSVSQLLALRPHRRGHSRMQQNAAECSRIQDLVTCGKPGYFWLSPGPCQIKPATNHRFRVSHRALFHIVYNLI